MPLHVVLQAVCSLEAVATTRPNDGLTTTTVSSGDHSTDGATARTSSSRTGVVRCELTAAISNGSSTMIQLLFDVVHVDDDDVRPTTLL